MQPITVVVIFAAIIGYSNTFLFPGLGGGSACGCEPSPPACSCPPPPACSPCGGSSSGGADDTPSGGGYATPSGGSYATPSSGGYATPSSGGYAIPPIHPPPSYAAPSPIGGYASSPTGGSYSAVSPVGTYGAAPTSYSGSQGGSYSGWQGAYSESHGQQPVPLPAATYGSNPPYQPQPLADGGYQEQGGEHQEPSGPAPPPPESRPSGPPPPPPPQQNYRDRGNQVGRQGEYEEGGGQRNDRGYRRIASKA
ncbi:hypothetical protein Tcan_05337 [Toxocara canis]|uniref:Uncharacterized protein n=1 Tax=Toxocara canis TaxID=6265 RepID=A0A0B2W2B8_TOXCA|nr:hypothetical protein Tcan_05337 [Toxocara canis]